MRRVVSMTLTVCVLSACASLPHYEPRPARSSLGCIRSALALQPLPAVDSQAHCLAAGRIARYCSVSEAWLASISKEAIDLLGPGNAEWRDLRSDRRGIACARLTTDEPDLRTCCEKP
jgi:hypothetical protein